MAIALQRLQGRWRWLVVGSLTEREVARDVKNHFQTEPDRTDCEGAWLRLQTEEWGYRGKFKSK